MTVESTAATWSAMHGAQLDELVRHTQPVEVAARALPRADEHFVFVYPTAETRLLVQRSDRPSAREK